MKHKHLIVRAEVADPFRQEDQERAGQWLSMLVDKIGMKAISGPHVAFATAPGNTGITACVLIETSHVTLHVWDSASPPIAQLDVYTCSDLDPDAVLNELEVMRPTKVEYRFLDRERGLRESEDEMYRWLIIVGGCTWIGGGVGAAVGNPIGGVLVGLLAGVMCCSWRWRA